MTEQQTRIAAIKAGRHYQITTDGSSKPNPGTGGWAVVVQLKEGELVLRQRALAGQGEVMISTNNQMEMTAVLRGLERLTETLPVIIVTDSEYVINSAASLHTWKAAGWRNSGGAVKNQRLWEQLDQRLEGLDVEWVWQRGHVGHKLNEVANQLAGAAAIGRYPNGETSVKKRHPDLFW